MISDVSRNVFLEKWDTERGYLSKLPFFQQNTDILRAYTLAKVAKENQQQDNQDSQNNKAHM